MGWGTPAYPLAVPLTSESSGLEHVPPAAVSWGADRLDVFVVTKPRSLLGPRELVHVWWEGTAERPRSWAVSLPVGGIWSSESWGGRLWDVRPSAVSWSSGRLDVFANGDDGALRHWWSPGASAPWDGPETLRGRVRNGSGSCAVAQRPGRLDVFAIGEDGGLLHWWYDEQAAAPFGDPEDLGGRLREADPAVVSWAPGRLDVFALDENQALVHWWYHEGDHEFDPEPEIIDPGGWGHGVSAASWGPGRLDIFDGALRQSWFYEAWGYPGYWPAPEPMEDAAPTAIAPAQDRLHALGVTPVSTPLGSRQLRHIWWDGGSWHDETLGETWVSHGGPAAVVRAADKLDVFAIHDSNVVSGATDQLQYYWLDPEFAIGEAVITTPDRLPDAYEGRAYSVQLQVTGVRVPVHWEVIASSLPGGIRLSDSGLLAASTVSQFYGDAHFTVRVRDSSPIPAFGTKEFVIRGVPASQPPPPPDVTHVSRLVVWNCWPEENPISVWLNDGSAGIGWQRVATIDTQYVPPHAVPSSCGPGVTPPGADVPLADGHVFNVVITMPAHCPSGDNPDDGACMVAGPWVVRGDASAPARIVMP
jgi:hypothetical protein